MQLPVFGRRRPRRAYLLLIVLGFSSALVVLFVSLSLQGQSLLSLVTLENDQADIEVVTLDTDARVGLILSDDPAHPLPDALKGKVTLASNFKSGTSGSKVTASVRWGKNSGSVRYPVATGYASYKNFYTKDGDAANAPNADYQASGDAYGPMPRVGYQDDLLGYNSAHLPVSPGHVLVTQEKLGGSDVVTVFDQSFPYGAYAPKGKVQLQDVVGWSNPTLETWDKTPPQDDDILSYGTGVPVLIRAQGAVNVTGNFPSGQALSDQGPITVKGGALAFTGTQQEDDYCQRFSAQVVDAMRALSSGTLDKTGWILGRGLSLASIRNLFSDGNKGGWSALLKSFLSADQAFHFPIPPIPVFQEDALISVLLIHNPWPADFTGGGSTSAEIQATIADMKKIADEITGMKKTISDDNDNITSLKNQLPALQTALANAKTDDEKKSIQKQIDDLNGQINAAGQKLTNDTNSLNQLKDQLKADQDKLESYKVTKENSTATSHIPTNASEDSNMPTGSGWSYVALFENLGRTIKDIIKGKIADAFDTLCPPVRLNHFGEEDPEWKFSSDSDWNHASQKGFVLKSTLNVPRGKTLSLGQSSGDYVEVQGDVWVQAGATLTINGNFTVSKPDSWSDFYAVEDTPDDPTKRPTTEPVNVTDTDTDGRPNTLYPWGRIILEEGATLVVTGDINVTGGHPELGSVICCSRIGSTRGVNNAILCQGSINLAYGIYSGMTLEDLCNRLAAKELPALGAFTKEFLDPAFHLLLPNIAKVLGPFDKREPPYFAEFATTFVFLNFLDEFGVGEIPLPIPLPCDNLDREVFTALSTFYSYSLSMSLGENFYTQSQWWLLGRGVVPYSLKTSPAAVVDAFGDINYQKIAADVTLSVLKGLLTTVVPQIVENLANKVLVDIVTTIIKENIPFGFLPTPDSAGESKTLSQKIEDDVKTELKKFVTGTVKKKLIKAAKQVAVKVKNSILTGADGTYSANYVCREMPGVLVYAGKSLTIGGGDLGPALTATGFFYAEGDVNIAAKRIVGAMVSRSGSISGQGTLYFYPYFAKASLYNPPKPSTYNDAPSDDLRNLLELFTPDPGKNTSIDLGVPTSRITARGELK